MGRSLGGTIRGRRSSGGRGVACTRPDPGRRSGRSDELRGRRIMMRRVGRPGLVGTMARTAVVAGTATAVSGGMVRHAQKKEMSQQQDEYYQQQQMQAQIDQAAAA